MIPAPSGISYPKQSQRLMVPRSPFRQYLCIAQDTKFDFGAMVEPGRKQEGRDMMENQMLEIYKYITNLQKEIGNDVEIKLSVRDGGLVIHAYYYSEDFNVEIRFSIDEMEHVGLGSCPHTAFFVGRCKCEFERRLKSRECKS